MPLVIFNNVMILQSSSPTRCLESLPRPCGMPCWEQDLEMQHKSVEGCAEPQTSPG